MTYIADAHIGLHLRLSKPKNIQDADEWYSIPGWYLRAYSNEGYNQVDPPEWPVGDRLLTDAEVDSLAAVLGERTGSLLRAGHSLAQSTQAERAGHLQKLIADAQRELHAIEERGDSSPSDERGES